MSITTCLWFQGDPRRAGAATQAMLGQRRIVVAELEAAADRAVAGAV